MVSIINRHFGIAGYAEDNEVGDKRSHAILHHQKHQIDHTMSHLQRLD